VVCDFRNSPAGRGGPDGPRVAAPEMAETRTADGRPKIRQVVDAGLGAADRMRVEGDWWVPAAAMRMATSRHRLVYSLRMNVWPTRPRALR
jgi:hypothetical protein